MDYINNQKGFSLVELVIGMVVLVVILGGIYQILTGMNRSQRYNLEAAANIQDQRVILNSIATELRNAVRLTINEDGTMITYRKNGDTDDQKISRNNDTNTVVFTDSGDAVVNSYGPGRISRLRFTSDADSARKVTIELTVINAEQAGAPENTISTVVYTLNNLN